MSGQAGQETISNPYQGLLGDVAQVWDEQAPLATQNAAIQDERKARIEAVVTEFEPILATSKAALDENEARRSPLLVRQRLAELYQADTTIGQAVVDIAIRHWWGGSVSGLANAIAQRPDRRNNPRPAYVGFIEQHIALAALDSEFASVTPDTYLPVMLLHLSRIEEVDEREEWDGRDGRTGEFYTELNAIYGVADQASLRVRRTVIARDDTIIPVQRTDAIDLHLTHATSHAEPHGRFVETNSAAQTARLGLFGAIVNHWSRPVSEIEEGPVIDWRGSHNHDYKPERSRGDYRHLYLQVGHASVTQAIERVGTIRDLSHSSKQFLEAVTQALPQTTN